MNKRPSIVEEVDGYDIAAEVRAERQTRKGAVLIIEGNNDKDIFNNFIDTNACAIVVAHGKDNAIDAIDRLDDEGFSGALCIIDSDYEAVDKMVIESDNLLLTDVHDLDSLTVKSPSLDKLISVRDRKGDIALFFERRGGDIRQLALALAKPIGLLRWVSDNLQLGLVFKDMSYEFIDVEKGFCDTEAMLKYIISRSAPIKFSENQLIQRMEKIGARNIDLWKICQGHDLCTVIGLIFHAVIRGIRHSRCIRSEIEAGLRLGFDIIMFSKTDLFPKILEWEKRSGYVVLYRIPYAV